MAKTIKFNLILDEHPVRNLEGLQEHFCIEDILKYYQNGLLLRWLDVRGYKRQYEAVKEIKDTADVKMIIMELIKIFELEEISGKVEQAIAILSYQEEEKIRLAEYEKNKFAKKQIIDQYHSEYFELIEHMIKNKDNMALLKADSIQLENEYMALFKLEHIPLYFRLVEKAPKAIFAMLTRDAFRSYWIGEDANQKIYKHIQIKLSSPKDRLMEILGDDLKIVKRNTQAMWDPIEPSDVEVMVLNMEPGTFIKNEGAFSEKFGEEEVIGTFMKLKGLEYQCNNESYELIYMEV